MLELREQNRVPAGPGLGKPNPGAPLGATRRPEKGEGFPEQRIVVLPRGVVAKTQKAALLRGLVPTDIGIFPRAAGHLRERRAGVDQAIFIYCTHGAGWCEMRGQRHEVHAGELLVVPPGEPHIYGADERQPWTIPWFHLSGEEVPFLLEELGVTAESPVLYVGEDPQMLSLFEDALGVLEHGYTSWEMLYASRALGHLVGRMIWRRHQHWRGEADSRQKVMQCISLRTVTSSIPVFHADMV